MAVQYSFGRIITDGLVLALDAADKNSYPGSGTTWTDLSGNGYNGTLTNGPTFSSANGGSIVFDGVDDFVSLGTSLGNNFNSITVNCWIKPTTLLTGSYVFQGIINADDNTSAGLEGVFSLSVAKFITVTSLPSSFIGDFIYFGVRSSGQSNRFRPITIADNIGWADYLPGMAIYKNPIEYNIFNYINITGVYDGSNTLLYVNSILKASSTLQPDGQSRSVTGNINTSSIPRTVGSLDGSSYLPGNISNAMIYNRALSASEILQNYNAQKSRFGL